MFERGHAHGLACVDLVLNCTFVGEQDVKRSAWLDNAFGRFDDKVLIELGDCELSGCVSIIFEDK